MSTTAVRQKVAQISKDGLITQHEAYELREAVGAIVSHDEYDAIESLRARVHQGELHFQKTSVTQTPAEDIVRWITAKGWTTRLAYPFKKLAEAWTGVDDKSFTEKWLVRLLLVAVGWAGILAYRGYQALTEED